MVQRGVELLQQGKHAEAADVTAQCSPRSRQCRCASPDGGGASSWGRPSEPPVWQRRPFAGIHARRTITAISAGITSRWDGWMRPPLLGESASSETDHALAHFNLALTRQRQSDLAKPSGTCASICS
jgi:hypothetical protein